MTQRIVNASPLIFLAKLERLELLLLGVEEVLVPSQVLEEIRAKPDVAVERIQNCLDVWLKTCHLSHPELLRLLPDLGAGERDVIAQALQQNITSVVLDDLEARRVARRVGLEPIGTVGLLLAAKKRSTLPSLKQELERLRDFGFRMSEALYSRVLQEAGEK